MTSKVQTWALCQFTKGGKLYAFKTYDHFTPGDILVVPSDRGVLFTCVEFVREEFTFAPDPLIGYKWVIQKVDNSNLDPTEPL